MLRDKRQMLLTALVLLAGLCLYAPAMDNGFRADDWQFLAAALGSETAADLFIPRQDVAFFRPVALALFWLEERLFGFRGGLFIAFNVLLHALNALLAVRLFGRLGLSDGARGLAGAMFFLGVFQFSKQVTWACTGGGLLAVTLILAALLIDLGGRRARLPLLIAIALVAPFAHELGLLVAPLLFLRRLLNRESNRGRVLEAALLLLLGGGLWAVGNVAHGVGTPEQTLGASGPLAISGRYLGYPGLMLLPLQESAAARAALPGSSALFAALRLLQPLLGLAALAAALVLAIRRGDGGPRFLGAWFLLALAPFAFVPTPAGWLDLRYLYPAALPACALAALLIARIARRRRAVAVVLAGALILVAASLTLLLERSYDRQARAESHRLEEFGVRGQ